MSLNRSRLDRFIGQQCAVSRRDVRLMLAKKRVVVDGVFATDIEQIIDKFSYICLDGQVLQKNTAHYLMLHKPIGVVSATKDEKHQTVIELLDKSDSTNLNGHSNANSNADCSVDCNYDELHIVGRLDLNTSGLMLLTNDSRWSSHLTSPENKIIKKYLVTLEKPLTAEYISAFAQGMYFGFEDITTLPAKLEIISDYVAEVSLMEGRYHQIKRMFGRFQNPVVALHRLSIGNLTLDPALVVGASRELSSAEVLNIKN
jgi:16S rRNA pseudouridine516 synthase